MGDTEHSVTSEEIEKWNAEHDEPHPVFVVEHRPERQQIRSTDGEAEREPAALRHGKTVPTAYHTIGGRHPDGTPISLGAWTFETPQVRDVVECYLSGDALNACAGKTHLSHPTIHRNDLDDRRDADTHHDVRDLDDYLPAESFDVVVFDPPFDGEQAREHYDGRTVGRGPSGGIWAARKALARLTRPGGRVLCVGWNSVGLSYLDDFEREAVHLFQRPQKPDVFLTVDRKMQTTLARSVDADVEEGY